MRLDASSVGWGRELRDRKPRPTQPAGSGSQGTNSALGRWRRGTTCKGSSQWWWHWTSRVRKSPQEPTQGCHATAFPVCRGWGEAPRSCLGEVWLWILPGHSKQQVCAHWKPKALKPWAEVHTAAGQTLSTPHRQRTTQSSCPLPAVAHKSYESPTLVQIQYQDRGPLPNLRLSSKAPSPTGWKRAKAAMKGWRKWGRSLRYIIEGRQHLPKAC